MFFSVSILIHWKTVLEKRLAGVIFLKTRLFFPHAEEKKCGFCCGGRTRMSIKKALREEGFFYGCRFRSQRMRHQEQRDRD